MAKFDRWFKERNTTFWVDEYPDWVNKWMIRLFLRPFLFIGIRAMVYVKCLIALFLVSWIIPQIVLPFSIWQSAFILYLIIWVIGYGVAWGNFNWVKESQRPSK
jgi:hypothetical protein